MRCLVLAIVALLFLFQVGELLQMRQRLLLQMGLLLLQLRRVAEDAAEKSSCLNVAALDQMVHPEIKCIIL